MTPVALDHTEELLTSEGLAELLGARADIATRLLDRVNASPRGDYRRYYDKDLIDGVAARYARDLELFGYDFEGLP